MPLADAIATLHIESGGERVVLNTANGTAAIVRPALVDQANRRYRALDLGWSPDNTLLISADGATYARNATTGVRPTQAVVPTPTPFSAGTRSSDGSWSAQTENTTEWNDTTVELVGRSPAFRLVRVAGVQWSPTEPSKLAAIGNPCSKPMWDVMLFDVTTGVLKSLTSSLPVLTNFLWRPNGTEIAVEAWASQGLPARIALVNTEGAQVAAWSMNPAPGGLGPLPESWSPDGSQLLVRFEGGHGGLFCEHQPTWLPSSAERLSP